jgi:hypothetical protein
VLSQILVSGIEIGFVTVGLGDRTAQIVRFMCPS